MNRLIGQEVGERPFLYTPPHASHIHGLDPKPFGIKFVKAKYEME